MHIWLGQLPSQKEFEKYLDQKKYLKAWAVYNHEPPTGNKVKDAEPSQELRCDFCKEVGLDTYDEDAMIMKYYRKPVDIREIARDILVDEKELESLRKKNKINDFNSVIAYEDNSLSKKAAAGSQTVNYIGQLMQASDENSSDSSAIHHLWVGENKLDKKNIIKQIGIDKDKLIKINYYHAGKSGKLDEILILQIEDFNVAEKMILKVDKMKIPTASSMLELILPGSVKINGEDIADVLGMKYVGKFDGL